MYDRQKTISRLIADRNYRAAYIRAKLDVLIPSQLRALRLHQDKTQPELAQLADMKQSRISAMETPGRVNFNNETLVRMAATLNVGMKIQFVPFSEMLEWENSYSQDTFEVTQLRDDVDFLETRSRVTRKQRAKRTHKVRRSASSIAVSGIAIAVSQQQGIQMELQFAAPESPLSDLFRSVIIFSDKKSIVNDIAATAATGAGAVRSYVYAR